MFTLFSTPTAPQQAPDRPPAPSAQALASPPSRPPHAPDPAPGPPQIGRDRPPQHHPRPPIGTTQKQPGPDRSSCVSPARNAGWLLILTSLLKY